MAFALWLSASNLDELTMAKGLKTGGRKAGTPNKTTVEIRDAARKHAKAALAELARIMTKSTSDTARIAAARELLDRAYGKAPQAMTGEGGEGPQEVKVSWDDKPSFNFVEHLQEVLGQPPRD